VGRIIRRQELRRVDTEREQVADGVGVLDPVHPMQAWRRKMRLGLAVQLPFHPPEHRLERRRIGAPRIGRRHQAGPHLPHDQLRDFGVFAEFGEVQFVEQQTRGLQSRVMTCDTVLVDQRTHLGAVESRPLGGRIGLCSNGRRCLGSRCDRRRRGTARGRGGLTGRSGGSRSSG
jgi:hypothetical protein